MPLPSFDSTTQDKIVELRGLRALGVQIETYEIVKVEWPSPTGTIGYAVQQTDEVASVPPNVDFPIVGRMVPKSRPDWFCETMTTGSIGDEKFDIEMWDADGTIAQHLVDHGEGVKLTSLYWFPQVELLLPWWEGHLMLEDGAEVDTLKLSAVQGFRNSEGLLPGGGHFQFCWSLFGGNLPTQELIDENPCPYNKHLGGSVGIVDPDTGEPFTGCDRLDTSSCTTRGIDPLFHYSHRTITVTVFNGQTKGGALFSGSQGNENNLPDPVRVVFAPRRINGMQVIAFRRDLNNNHPDQGFFFAAYEACHGPQASFSGARFTVGGATQEANPLHWNYRLGTFGQTAWTGLSTHGYSGIAYNVYNFGWVNPSNIDPGDASGSVICGGMTDVRIYSDADTYTTGVTTNPIWQLLRMLCDKTWGYGYDYSRWNIDSLIETADWCAESVRFTDTFGNNWDHVRSDSYPDLPGKKVQQQIEDLCMAMRLTRPFLFNGEMHILPLRALTTDELAAAPVFTDEGETRNIIAVNGKSTLKISRLSDLELTNQIKVTFDDRGQDWTNVPLRPVEDVDAQLRAGVVVGDHTRKVNSKSYNLSGVTYEPQATKVAWSLLDLGQFDEGGLRNNLELKFNVWYLDTLDLYQSKVIAVRSSRLTKYKQIDGTTPFTYFRIKSMKRTSKLEVELTVQAYSEIYMATFETTPGGSGGDVCSTSADCPVGYECIDGICVPNIGAGGHCDVDSDCPDGYECVNGICVPVIGGGCRPGIASVTFRDGVATLMPILC